MKFHPVDCSASSGLMDAQIDMTKLVLFIKFTLMKMSERLTSQWLQKQLDLYCLYAVLQYIISGTRHKLAIFHEEVWACHIIHMHKYINCKLRYGANDADTTVNSTYTNPSSYGSQMQTGMNHPY
jgi:hypothetical protein